MITPIHLLFDFAVYTIADKSHIINVNNIDLLLIFSADLIDLDHLFAKPIFDPKRNGFKTHPLHRNRLAILILAIGFLFFRPLLFLGLGLISHLFLDYCDVKINKLKSPK